ncbi:hypothetical protein WJX77_012206 [Trebouxia sp. C0004]
MKEESVSRFQDHWRRFMYPPDTWRKLRWIGDPVIARAQHSSSSQHSELRPAGAQTSDDVSKGHNAEPGCILDFKLLQACKLGNSREAVQMARQATMLSNESDVRQHVARNIVMMKGRDSEGVSCLHPIAQSPFPDLSLKVLPILVSSVGAELMHLRTRWGLHAMHYAEGNLVQGCQVLTQMIGYRRLSPHQVVGGVLECRDARGCTPLHRAAKVGNAEAITLLLNAGADANAQDHAHASPLHYAVVSPTAYRLKCITKMLAVSWSSQADVAAKDINDQTPMHWLAGACHLSVHLDAMTLLVMTSSSLPATASMILSFGADPEAVNVYGDTALHTAAGFGNIALLECLTEETQRGGSLTAALSCTNRAGHTPLQLAVVVGWREPVQSASRRVAESSAVDFVTARRPVGLDPRPQSNFISLGSQTVLTVFNSFYDLPGYMQSYNQPIKAVDEMLSGLLDSCNSQSDHFLGSLAMFRGPFTGHYWLVDGHQKLTSLQLILAFGMHWAKSQGASQAALFNALKRCLWAENAEEAPSRQDDQKFLCANVLQSFLPQKYEWQAEASDTGQSDSGPTSGGVVSDHSAGCQGSWADCPQALSNAVWLHAYANARRVQQVLTDEQEMHHLDLAAFFRHMCQRCHMTRTIFRDEGSAFHVLGRIRIEGSVMDRVKIGLLQLLPPAGLQAFAERWSFWEMELGSSLFEKLFIYSKQILRPADTGSKVSLLQFYLNTVNQDCHNAGHKATAVKSCLTQLFQCAAILHQLTSYGFAASTTTVSQPAAKQEALLQAETVTDMDADTEMQKLPLLDRSSAAEKQPGKTAAGASVIKETGCSDKAEAKGRQITKVKTLQSLDELCRFLMLMPDREWVGLALHFCLLEQNRAQRLAFFGCLESLQVFFWLTEATADSKKSCWKCITEKLSQEPCQSQDQMQQSQQQQQQQEEGRSSLQGLVLQVGLVQQPAWVGTSIPAPAHLGLQAAELTDIEKASFKAELSRSELLSQGNMGLVRYLLLRAEDTLLWESISWSQLQVDQILPDQPCTDPVGPCGSRVFWIAHPQQTLTVPGSIGQPRRSRAPGAALATCYCCRLPRPSQTGRGGLCSGSSMDSVTATYWRCLGNFSTP